MATTSSRSKFSAVALALIPLFAAPSDAGARDAITVYTDAWPPYVRSPGGHAGSATRIVRLVLDDMASSAAFEFFDYAYSYRAVKAGRPVLAFPYFRTAGRAREVLFSTPLFTVSNQIYYNRRYHAFEACDDGMEKLEFGRVAGYSYGEQFDTFLQNPTVFASEVDAIEALLAGTIDALPMTTSVADAFLEESFPDRRQLISAIDGEGCSSPSTLHVIAPDTQWGQSVIERFNESHERLLSAGVILNEDQSALTAFAREDDVAVLLAAEGFPVVVGIDPGEDLNYALPQGTRVIVLEWSPRISNPSQNDRLYQTMVDESLVLVLNGPHVGRELRVKNMHIHLAP